MAGMAETFADRLQRTEEAGDPTPLLDLFAADAELRNLSIAESGPGAAERFWRTYLDQFEHVRSTFSRLIDAGDESVLVWTSEGALKDGRPITYQGVSVVETEDGKVRRFETYYDSAAFLRPELPDAAGANRG